MNRFNIPGSQEAPPHHTLNSGFNEALTPHSSADTLEQSPGSADTWDEWPRAQAVEMIENPEALLIKQMENFLGHGFTIITAEEYMKSIDPGAQNHIGIPAVFNNKQSQFVVLHEKKPLDFITINISDEMQEIKVKLNVIKTQLNA